MINDKRNLKEFIFSNIEFGGREKILDLGCGNGDDIKLLMELHPKSKFEIHAIDKIENQINDSRIIYLKRNIEGELPFEDNMFDIVYSHNFLECIKNKKEHILELSRILKPFGRVIYSHTDWDTQIFDVEEKDLARKILEAYSEWQQPWMDNIDSWIGRRLNGIFNDSGCFVGNTKAYTIINTRFDKGSYCYNMIYSFKDLVEEKLISKFDYDDLIRQLKEKDMRKKFFYAITSFIYYGENTKLKIAKNARGN